MCSSERFAHLRHHKPPLGAVPVDPEPEAGGIDLVEEHEGVEGLVLGGHQSSALSMGGRRSVESIRQPLGLIARLNIEGGGGDDRGTREHR